MSEWKWTEGELGVSLGRLGSAVVAGGSLYLVRHADLATYRVDGDAVEVWHEPLGVHERVLLDDRNMQVTLDPDGVLYALLGDGSLFSYERGGALTAISGPDLRTSGHYARRTGFVWDPLERCLVLAGGDDRNDAYVIDAGDGSIAPLPHGPPHGVGQTVATTHGVYRMVGAELWLLEGRRWSLVGRHDRGRRDHGALLFWDPELDALFFVSEPLDFRDPPVRVQMSVDGPGAPLRLPGSFEGPLAAHEAVAQIDPRMRRLWVVDRLGARFLELDALHLTAGSPVAPIPHERPVVASPPVHWFREALALRQRDALLPDLGVAVREGWILAATLPLSPHLPLREKGTLLLFSRDAPYDFDPWTLGYMNAFEVRIVDDELPLTAGGQLLDVHRYLEVDPVLAHRTDTAHDGATYLARGSKIGGFPSLVQGTKEEVANGLSANLKCEDCEAYLRFVAQLTWPEWDLISAVVYVYACPFGHSGAARAQNV